MKKFVCLMVSSFCLLTGCQTVKGVGEDISRLGNAVSQTANQAGSQHSQTQPKHYSQLQHSQMQYVPAQ